MASTLKRPRLASPGPADARALNREIIALAPSAVLALIAARGASFNDVNCSTALARVCRTVTTAASPTITGLVVHTAAVVRSTASNGRTLTSMAHSLGVLGQSAGAATALEGAVHTALAVVAPAACAAFQRCDLGAPGALATTLWALGTLRWVPPDEAAPGALFAAAAAAAPQMSAAELSNAAWGAARAGVRSSILMAALGRAAAALAAAGAFSPQGLASTAWAWAKLRLRPPSALAEAALAGLLGVRRLPAAAHGVTGSYIAPPPPPPWKKPSVFDSDPQALAMLAWAWARWPNSALNTAISAAVGRILAAKRTLPLTACVSLLQASMQRRRGSPAGAFPLSCTPRPSKPSH